MGVCKESDSKGDSGEWLVAGSKWPAEAQGV